MGDKYNCDEKNTGYENQQEKVDINMSSIFQVSNLESKNVMDYLKSFSQKSIEIQDKKTRKIKKRRYRKRAKPYSTSSKGKEPFESIPCISSKNHSQTSLGHKEKDDTNITPGKKSLRIKNKDGTITEVTLEPVVLMHVREMPSSSGDENKNISSFMAHSQTSHEEITNHVNDPLESTKPVSRAGYEDQDHGDANILRVKSSRNCTDLSSERKQSTVKIKQNILITPENFRVPSFYPNGNRLVPKVSTITFSNFPNVYFHNYNPKYDPNLQFNPIPQFSSSLKFHSNSKCNPDSQLNPNAQFNPNSNQNPTLDSNRSFQAFHEKLNDRKDITRVSSDDYIENDSSLHFSVTTFFRRPDLRDSNTSSGYQDDQENLDITPSIMYLK